jgi:hypothetical protein
MNSPRVIELPRRLEPVSRDSFLEHRATVIVLPSRQQAQAQAQPPQPPRRAA